MCCIIVYVFPLFPELQLFEKYKHDERIRAYEAKIKEQEKQARREKLHHLKDGDEREFQYVLEKNGNNNITMGGMHNACVRMAHGL